MMTVKRDDFEPPKPWEILGAFFGYFAVAKDAPSVMRTLGATRLCPDWLRTCLLDVNKHADTWLLWMFTIVTVVFLSYLLWRRRPREAPSDSDDMKDALRAMKRHRILRIVRSLGLVLVRNAVMDLLGVTRYGTFKKPSTWPRDPKIFNYVDRINLTGGKGLEYQYARDFSNLLVREHPPTTDDYGPTAERRPTWNDFKVLIAGSNIFLLWFPAHLVMRLFR